MPAQINTTESTFFTDAKRFLEPLKYMKIATAKNVLDTLWQNSFVFVWVFMLPWIIGALERQNRTEFLLAVGVFWGLILLHWWVRIAMHRWGFVTFINGFFPYLRSKYWPRLIALDNSMFEMIGTGRILTIIERGIEAHNHILLGTVRMGTMVTASSLFMIGYLYWAYPKLLLIALGLIPISVLTAQWAMKKSRLARVQKMEIIHATGRHQVKMIMSKFEILQNSKTTREVKTWTDMSHQTYPYNATLELWSRISLGLGNIGPDAIRIGLFLFLGFLVLKGEWSIGLIAAVGAVWSVIDRVIGSITDLTERFHNDFIHIRKLWDTFDTTPEIQGYDSWKIFSPQGGKIELSNVYFNYGESAILKNFSVVLIKGKKTALVGASGGGKTTIMKLIAGYLRPTSGSIIIDGQKLEETALKTYYPHIGYLTQEPSVFDGSIRENLLYWASETTTDGQMMSAIEKAQCQFILDFEKGLDTEIWEKGIRLSGGQRQRLAIAKIFLKNPEIILLDEPTSALDSFSEEKITEALNELFKGRTVLIIAHRLQTVRHADEILVIEWGEIIERGDHLRLSADKNTTYAKMLELQSGI